jgi:hypothetical protein
MEGRDVYHLLLLLLLLLLSDGSGRSAASAKPLVSAVVPRRQPPMARCDHTLNHQFASCFSYPLTLDARTTHI